LRNKKATCSNNLENIFDDPTVPGVIVKKKLANIKVVPVLFVLYYPPFM